ncbi:MAG: MarR family transcriptional regulator [Pseudomonadota bacterium]|nr:MarR family transcriptional regulator [Pseudomonadota bacterium]
MRDGRDLSVIFKRPTIRDTFRISYLANRLVLPAYNDIKRVYGLSRGEYLLLFCLSYIEELTAQDVAEMTGRPRNSISRAVHRMLDEGYLKRSPDPADGRQALLRITAKGERLHKRILPLFEEQEAKMLNNLTSEERKILDSLLKKLVLRD